jgi:hypothetical protein
MGHSGPLDQSWTYEIKSSPSEPVQDHSRKILILRSRFYEMRSNRIRLLTDQWSRSDFRAAIYHLSLAHDRDPTVKIAPPFITNPMAHEILLPRADSQAGRACEHSSGSSDFTNPCPVITAQILSTLYAQGIHVNPTVPILPSIVQPCPPPPGVDIQRSKSGEIYSLRHRSSLASKTDVHTSSAPLRSSER